MFYFSIPKNKFKQKTEQDQERPPYRYSCEYPGVHKTIRKEGKVFHGFRPDHLSVWKRELALKVKFPDINISEDHRWGTEMIKHYSPLDQYVIEKELYWYRCDATKTSTRK